MMERITIEVGDDGRITVMAESPDEEMETMEFDNVEDAMQAVQGLIMDEEMDKEMESEDEDSGIHVERRSSKAPNEPQHDAIRRSPCKTTQTQRAATPCVQSAKN
jgi:hypothetical protein